ncbi:hypothetical protein Dgeo_2975 (plasmid) [Deinococcus geothermalis DSM 11300]|uniref:Uncharacterized protein n=2 Tax=Deinococcaceae TaxID=183710 RepID=A8ZRA9_DEIGD|nr:hypothetical protein Dgeo_2975 [Deinococcus geothermalis DSM 11300]
MDERQTQMAARIVLYNKAAGPAPAAEHVEYCGREQGSVLGNPFTSKAHTRVPGTTGGGQPRRGRGASPRVDAGAAPAADRTVPPGAGPRSPGRSGKNPVPGLLLRSGTVPHRDDPGGGGLVRGAGGNVRGGGKEL